MERTSYLSDVLSNMNSPLINSPLILFNITIRWLYNLRSGCMLHNPLLGPLPPSSHCRKQSPAEMKITHHLWPWPWLNHIFYASQKLSVVSNFCFWFRSRSCCRYCEQTPKHKHSWNVWGFAWGWLDAFWRWLMIYVRGAQSPRSGAVTSTLCPCQHCHC